MIKEELKLVNEQYVVMVEGFEKSLDSFVNQRLSLPNNELNEKAAESVVLRSANLKFEASKFAKETMALSKRMVIDIDYYSGRIVLGDADTVLKELGFSKITEALRSSVVNTLEELRDLKKLQIRIEALYYYSINLIKQFEGDENSARKIYEIKNKGF